MAKQTALQRKSRRSATPNPIGRISDLEHLDPNDYAKMLTYVRGGAYDTQAAKSLGVTPRTFARWKATGAEHEEQDVESAYRQLYHDLCKAKGAARIIAEIKVKEQSPITWLRSGPGRPEEYEQGWTDDKAIVQHEGGQNPIQVDHVHRILGENPKDRIAAIAGAFGVFKELEISPEKVTALLSEKAVEESDNEELDYEEQELRPDDEFGFHAPNGNGNGKH